MSYNMGNWVGMVWFYVVVGFVLVVAIWIFAKLIQETKEAKEDGNSGV